MKSIFHQLIIFVSLFASAFITAEAQSFDLRPQTNNTKKGDETLLSFLDKNDVEGMRLYLQNNKTAVNTNSRVIKSKNGLKQPLPLLFDAVKRALFNQENGSAEMCKVIIDAGCDLYPVFEGTTPIYLLMEYFATHKNNECDTAIKILKAFDSRRDWDANQRYRSELPPINYLIRRNYEFLNKHFSKEYIDEEVLKILIGHGASTSSYTDEGQTLMTFALETENQYLQSYFLNNGVNLMHQDERGHNDLYRMIESNNLSILKDAYHKGKLDLNINTLENNPKDFVQNKDLYEFVSGVCADKANSYEDIVLFRKRFSERKDLVQQKYEDLAKKDVNACTNFNMIDNCIKRFPDLKSITGPKLLTIAEDELKTIKTINDIKTFELHYPELKEKALEQKEIIYKADCMALKKAYDEMKVSLQNQSMDVNTSISSKFIEDYSKYYDPQQQISLAIAMNSFVDVLKTAQKKFAPYYSSSNSFDHQYNSDINQLNKALSDCKNIQKYELSSDWLTNMIVSKKEVLTNHYKECREALQIVDNVTENSVPKPLRESSSGKNYYFSWKDFSFTVTDYSTDNDEHYVVHGMKGGKLSNRFIKGYGSLKGAIIAGWTAATYGFAWTKDPPRWTGGLLSGILLQRIGKKRELDLYQARESDEVSGIVDDWIGN